MHIRELLIETRLAGKFTAYGSFIRSFSGPGTPAQEQYMDDVVARLKEYTDQLGFTMTPSSTNSDKNSMRVWYFMSPQTASLRSAGHRATEFNQILQDIIADIQKTIPEYNGYAMCNPYYVNTNHQAVSLGSPHELQPYLSGEESLDRFLTNTGLIDKIGRDQIVSGD